MIWNEILCLGDSITTGARDRYKRCYPMELARLMTEKTGEFYFCHDHGVCGETSSDLLRRVWGAAKSHKDANIAIVMIGTNDTQINIPEHIYKDNLRQIISVLQLHGMKVVVATLPKLGFTPLYLNNIDKIEVYNSVIKDLCLEMGVEICEVTNTEKYYIDGVHYSHEGYNHLAKLFANKILSLNGD